MCHHPSSRQPATFEQNARAPRRPSPTLTEAGSIFQRREEQRPAVLRRQVARYTGERKDWSESILPRISPSQVLPACKACLCRARFHLQLRPSIPSESSVTDPFLILRRRPVAVQNPPHQVLGRLDCVIHRCLHWFAQSHVSIVTAQVSGLTPDEQNVFKRSLHRLCHA